MPSRVAAERDERHEVPDPARQRRHDRAAVRAGARTSRTRAVPSSSTAGAAGRAPGWASSAEFAIAWSSRAPAERPEDRSPRRRRPRSPPSMASSVSDSSLSAGDEVDRDAGGARSVVELAGVDRVAVADPAVDPQAERRPRGARRRRPRRRGRRRRTSRARPRRAPPGRRRRRRRGRSPDGAAGGPQGPRLAHPPSAGGREVAVDPGRDRRRHLDGTRPRGARPGRRGPT